MLTKEKILEKVNELPDEVNSNQLDALFNELLLIELLEKRSTSAALGNVTSHEDVLKKTQDWLT